MIVGCNMLEANNEMDRIVEHLVRGRPRLEIKGAKGAVPAASGVELGVDVIDSLRFLIHQSEIRIASTLNSIICRSWETTAKFRNSIQSLVDQILKMATNFINARYPASNAVWGINSFDYFVENAG